MELEGVLMWYLIKYRQIQYILGYPNSYFSYPNRRKWIKITSACVHIIRYVVMTYYSTGHFTCVVNTEESASLIQTCSD